MRPSSEARCWICGDRASDVATRDDECGSCEAATWIEPEITFKGCFWDDGWEFDGPCVLYSPFKGRDDAGNSGGVDRMVENACIEIILGEEVGLSRVWCESELREFKWRGWSPRGFARRRTAWHVEIVVRFTFDKAKGENAWSFETVSRRERFGLSGRWKVAALQS